jgi:hypothetical protein
MSLFNSSFNSSSYTDSEDEQYIIDKKFEESSRDSKFLWINRITMYPPRYFTPSSYLIHKDDGNVALRIFKFQ